MNSQKLNMDIRCLMKCEKITQIEIAKELGYTSSNPISVLLGRDNLSLSEFVFERQRIVNAIDSIRDRRKVESENNNGDQQETQKEWKPEI